MAAVHINRPPTFPLRRITYCPTEKRRRRFAGLDAPWYGTTWTCCGCGDSWTDGERPPRPFKPRWRPREIATAKDIWRQAGKYTRDEWSTWLRTEVFGHGEEG